jgi:hypothetical protein
LRRRVQRGELLHRVGGELLLIERGRLDEVAVGWWLRSRQAQGEGEQREKTILRMVTSSG